MANGEALDPLKYVENVTRTGLLLQQLAVDVKAIREGQESTTSQVESLRTQTNKIEKEFAVYQVGAESKIATNQESIRALEERLRWLSRLVIAALVTGVIGGILKLALK